MEIVKANTSCMDYEILKGVNIPIGAKETMDKIINKYMWKQIYDENLYFLDGRTQDNEQMVFDLNDRKTLPLKEYMKKYKTYSLIFNKEYCKTIIEDDVLALLISEATQPISSGLRNSFIVLQIQFLFKNRNCLTAMTYENFEEVDGVEKKTRQVDIFSGALYSFQYIINEYSCKFFGNDYADMIKKIDAFFGVSIIDGKPCSLKITGNIDKLLREKDATIPCKTSKAWPKYQLNSLIDNYVYEKEVMFEMHEDIIAIRLLKQYGEKAYEPYRIFIKDGEISCLKQSKATGFIPVQKAIHKGLNMWSIDGEEIPDYPQLKYVREMYIGSRVSMPDFLTAISSNMIEQLRKNDLTNAADRITALCVSHSCKIDTAFELVFGKLGPKKGLKKYLGINQQQLEWLKESLLNRQNGTSIVAEREMPSIRAMKYVLGMDSISSLDKDIFKEISEMKEFKRPWNLARVNKDGNWSYQILILECLMRYNASIRKTLDIYKSLSRWMKHIAASYIYDIVNMANLSKQAGLFNGNPFKGISDDNYTQMLPVVHDNLVLIYNTYNTNQKNKMYADDAFKKFLEKWSEYEFSSDNYVVIAPQKPMDVVTEGLTLHHCVKTFIPKIYNGTTNIFFVRKKGCEEIPFFTAEVDSSNTLRQVHGMCNCNVDTEEGLAEFIQSWIKDKKIKKGEYDRVLAAR